MNRQPRKILIRGVNWIGDAVITIPAVQSVCKAFPDAHITILVKPWVADIFRGIPGIDEIILYDERFRGLSGKLRLANKLRKKKFDTAILFQNAFDAALISRLAGIPERIGYKRDGRGLLLTSAIPVTESNLRQHQVYYYLDLLKSVDIKPSETRPYLPLTDDERKQARETLSSYFSDTGIPLIGINPGATFGSAKRWPPENFSALIIKIITELNGRAVLFGGPGEVEIANEIVSSVRLQMRTNDERRTTNDEEQTRGALQQSADDRRVLVMSGKTNLRELAALISECDVFVTNDSGPMHMASALLVPVIAIFGSTDSTATGPFGEGHKVITKHLSCAPCMQRECPEKHLKCMTDITADEVFDTVKESLAVNKAVFLDKDGTIIEDKNYLNNFDDLVILSGAKKSLQKLKKAGFRLIGVTNQSGIARGIVDEKFVNESNEYLSKQLGVDDFYYCPHHPDERCSCRKPEPLMPLKARLKHKINLKASYIIGDKESDVLLARKVGATGILLSSTPLFENTGASFIAKDIQDAVEWILERGKESTVNFSG